MNEELVQFALTEKLASGQDRILVLLDSRLIRSDRIGSGEIMYTLDTSYLQPEYILQCWIYQDGQLEECSREQSVEYQEIMDSREIGYVEFSILEQQLVAYVVWMWTDGKVPRASFCGGTYVLQKEHNHWQEMPELEWFWIS